MNNQEARFILQAYRHGGRDATDPAFAEALEQARRDPELARWFAAEQEFDAAVRAKLREVPVPSRLKDNILAGRKVVHPRRFLNKHLWLPLAACFVLFAGLLFWQFNRQSLGPIANARASLLAEARAYPQHVDFEATELEAAREWLKEHGGETNLNLPPGLAGLSRISCRVMDWQNAKVTMLCLFHNGDHLDLFVIDREAVADLPLTSKPRFARQDNRTTAMWRRGDSVYLLASTGDEASLRKLL